MAMVTLASLGGVLPREDTCAAPPEKRAAPVFIGDAVLPFAGETLLLSLLRAQALRDLDRNG